MSQLSPPAFGMPIQAFMLYCKAERMFEMFELVVPSVSPSTFLFASRPLRHSGSFRLSDCAKPNPIRWISQRNHYHVIIGQPFDLCPQHVMLERCWCGAFLLRSSGARFSQVRVDSVFHRHTRHITTQFPEIITIGVQLHCLSPVEMYHLVMTNIAMENPL